MRTLVNNGAYRGKKTRQLTPAILVFSLIETLTVIAHNALGLSLRQAGAFNPLPVRPTMRQAVTYDAAFSISVGVAAKYNSACVNTLRRSQDG